jgi:hypothetical protein
VGELRLRTSQGGERVEEREGRKDWKRARNGKRWRGKSGGKKLRGLFDPHDREKESRKSLNRTRETDDWEEWKGKRRKWEAIGGFEGRQREKAWLELVQQQRMAKRAVWRYVEVEGG